MEILKGPLADALARQRDSCNAKFAAARQRSAGLDSEGFLAHLASVLDPIIRGVAASLPEKVDLATTALFDLSLELFASRLLGPDAKSSWINQAWCRLLPRVPVLVAREPSRLTASVCNAILNIDSTIGGRPGEWLDRMGNLGACCQRVDDFLEAGKVVAWQCGMAHYRVLALDVANQLPASLAAAALGLPSDKASDVAAVTAQLNDDPWKSPLDAASQTLDGRSIQLVRHIGAFRGFGGVFLRSRQEWLTQMVN